ncbi:MAG: hypothetical protein ACXABY_06795, partial [Candidatus Thorarchaeota archaeon]
PKKKVRMKRRTRQPEWVPEGKRIEDLSPQMKWYYRSKFEGKAPYQKEARGEWPYGPVKGPRGCKKLFKKVDGKWKPRGPKAQRVIERKRREG